MTFSLMFAFFSSLFVLLLDFSLFCCNFLVFLFPFLWISNAVS